MKIEFLKSVFDIKDYKPFLLSEYAFAGKSNVGKSSLINSLFNCKIAMTSKKPGKTRCINFFKAEDKIIITDLPGYGFAKVSKDMQSNWKILIESYIQNSNYLKKVFILVDVQRRLDDDDKMLKDWLDFVGKPIRIVFTKVDKLSKNELNKAKKELAPLNPIFYSSLSGAGKKEILSELLG